MALWAAIHIDLAVGTDGKERVKAPCGGDDFGMILRPFFSSQFILKPRFSCFLYDNVYVHNVYVDKVYVYNVCGILS